MNYLDLFSLSWSPDVLEEDVYYSLSSPDGIQGQET